MAPASGQACDALLVHCLHRTGRCSRPRTVMVCRETHMCEHLAAIRHRKRGVAQALLCLAGQQMGSRGCEALAQYRRGDRHDLEDRSSRTAAQHAAVAHGRAHEAEKEHQQERRDRDDGHDRHGAHIPTGKQLEREAHEARLEETDDRRGQHRPPKIRPMAAPGTRRTAALARDPRKRRVAARLVGVERVHCG